MTEKRFTYDNKQVAILKDGEFWLEGQIDTACNHKEICDELNNLVNENEELKNNNKMLSMKMSEVSTKYRLLKEFSEDTDPNEAVKIVLHELMMITKEYR